MTHTPARSAGQRGGKMPASTSASPPVLSIVTTLFNSAGTIEGFYTRAVAAAEAVTDDFEIVIVDDGSPDDSLAIALRLAQRDARVKVVELSRNFGHHRALMTGMMHSAGEFCLLIDSDLEEDPALLAVFWEELHSGDLDAGDLDVVYGYQAERGGDIFKNISGNVAYWLFKVLIPYKIPRNHITLRLMRRPYVDALLLHKEQETAIGGLWVITGYRQKGIPVNKLVRPTTTYSFLHRWHRLIDSIASFSETPLVAIFYLGIVISMIAGVYAASLVIRWTIVGAPVPGWLSVVVSLWFLGGVTIFCIGVIGIYLSKIFIETKSRPYTIVRAIHRFDPRDSRTDEPRHDQANPHREREHAPGENDAADE